jgi:hypothetical protein
VEGGLFIAGVLIYLKSTKPRDKVGKWGLWTLIVLLILLYAVNFFGPAQPPAEMVDFLPRIALELFALLVAWAYWVDHHRKPV